MRRSTNGKLKAAAAAYYQQQPRFDAAESSEYGLAPEDFAEEDQVVWIWPENFDSFRVFCAMDDQWRPTNSGVLGLDYAVLPTVLRMLRIPRAAEPEIFSDLRVMARVARAKINGTELHE